MVLRVGLLLRISTDSVILRSATSLHVRRMSIGNVLGLTESDGCVSLMCWPNGEFLVWCLASLRCSLYLSLTMRDVSPMYDVLVVHK